MYNGIKIKDTDFGYLLQFFKLRRGNFMDDTLFEISAQTVTIEVVDEKTGKVIRRTLPIDYYENANCLRLRGENLDGSISKIVFYSATGMQHLKDLTGKGADHDSCGTH